MQRVVVRCRVLQCVALCSRTLALLFAFVLLQTAAERRSVLHCVAVCCSVLQRGAAWCSV